jgi:pantoate--beta-alanine ligase
MLKDLLLTHPSSQRLHIIPTARDATSGLALSSRNVYLTDKQRNHAPALYGSLCAGRDLWNSSPKTVELRDKVLLAAREYIYERIENAKEDGVEIKIDYVELCDANEFEAHVSPPRDTEAKMYVLSGAMWVGKTRLIDNILLYNPTSGTAS